MISQKTFPAEVETWVKQLCTFICRSREGQMYVAANEQLCKHGSNPILELAIKAIDRTLVDMLEPFIRDALAEFGLQTRAGGDVRGISRVMGRAFSDFGAATARQRSGGGLWRDRIPITATIGAVLGAMTDPDPGRYLAPLGFEAAMN